MGDHAVRFHDAEKRLRPADAAQHDGRLRLRPDVEVQAEKGGHTEVDHLGSKACLFGQRRVPVDAFAPGRDDDGLGLLRRPLACLFQRRVVDQRVLDGEGERLAGFAHHGLLDGLTGVDAEPDRQAEDLLKGQEHGGRSAVESGVHPEGAERTAELGVAVLRVRVGLEFA